MPPKTALGKELHHLDSHWLRLINYVQHGDYPIENYAAENAIRPFVVGRKIGYLVQANRAPHRVRIYTALIESAKANGLEPYAHLERVFTELPTLQRWSRLRHYYRGV